MIDENQYHKLAENETALARCYLDPRYGADPEFTRKTSELGIQTAALRAKLREQANRNISASESKSQAE